MMNPQLIPVATNPQSVSGKRLQLVMNSQAITWKTNPITKRHENLGTVKNQRLTTVRKHNQLYINLKIMLIPITILVIVSK